MLHLRLHFSNTVVQIINLFAVFFYSSILSIVIITKCFDAIVKLLNNNAQIVDWLNKLNNDGNKSPKRDDSKNQIT